MQALELILFLDAVWCPSERSLDFRNQIYKTLVIRYLNKVNKKVREKVGLMLVYTVEWDQDYSEEGFAKLMALPNHQLYMKLLDQL